MTIDRIEVHAAVDKEAVMEAVQADDNLGFCLACGAVAHGVEPDARRYECETCGVPGVYGAEEILLCMAEEILLRIAEG